MRFSERQEIRPVKKLIQIDSMDADLRNRLWNILDSVCWHLSGRSVQLKRDPELSQLVQAIWHDHFKEPIDTIPWSSEDAVREIRKRYFSWAWYAVYDLVDFIANAIPRGYWRDRLTDGSNQVLEEELSGYRFVVGRLTPVTAKEEVAAIERAIAETATAFPGSTKHLRTAIDLLAQKPKPDYRNSIKESISAVEALCAAVTGDPKTTLGEALRVIYPEAKLHGALRGAFEKLYGYTSDAQGIRHALMEEEHLEQEDATFMLVACSAFISYVIAKRARKG